MNSLIAKGNGCWDDRRRGGRAHAYRNDCAEWWHEAPPKVVRARHGCWLGTFRLGDRFLGWLGTSTGAWGWASAVLSGYVGLMAILALAVFIRRNANPDAWSKTKWLGGLLRTKAQREAAQAAEAAKDRDAYEKGYPDRSR